MTTAALLSRVSALVTEHGWSATAVGAAGRSVGSGTVFFPEDLRTALTHFNPGLSDAAVAAVIATVERAESRDLVSENRRVRRLLVDGVPLPGSGSAAAVERAKLIDWEQPSANVLRMVEELTVTEAGSARRLDLVLFVNGLPLCAVEIGRDLRGAYEQLAAHRRSLPSFFAATVVSIVASEAEARLAPVGGGYRDLVVWGEADAGARSSGTELEHLVSELLTPQGLLELGREQVVFREERSRPHTLIARRHQAEAVERLHERTVAAMRAGEGRGGIVVQPIGTGRSTTMLLYVIALIRDARLAPPTVVVVTERAVIEAQLLHLFSQVGELPAATVRVDSRVHLVDELSRSGPVVLITTLQKLSAGSGEPVSHRSDLVVICEDVRACLRSGLGERLRLAFPNATFAGFAADLPMDEGEVLAAFGEVVSAYTFDQALIDGVLVEVAREQPPPELALGADADALFQAVLADESAELTPRGWQAADQRAVDVEAVLAHPERLARVADHISTHWSERRTLQCGKAIVLCSSRRACADLYDEIVRRRPDWQGVDDRGGVVEALIVPGADELRARGGDAQLVHRLHDPDDELELLVVPAARLLDVVGAPSLHTAYLNQPLGSTAAGQLLAGLGLARPGKLAGLVVDYVGSPGLLSRTLPAAATRHSVHAAAPAAPTGGEHGEGGVETLLRAVVERRQLDGGERAGLLAGVRAATAGLGVEGALTEADRARARAQVRRALLRAGVAVGELGEIAEQVVARAERGR